MKILYCACFILITNARLVAQAATFQTGDILLDFFAGSPKLQQYRPNGELVQSFEGTGGAWLGATILSNRKLVTTRRLPTPGINIFDADGNETTFDTPQVPIPGDVSVFADGTLAISNQRDRRIDLYSPSGVYLGPISHPALNSPGYPFGNAIGSDDTLWVALFSGGITRFSRSGTFLGSFVPFEVQELAVDPVDGTLWVPAADGRVHHFARDGTEVSSFMSAVTPPFLSGIAVAADQSLYITSQGSTSVFHYSRSGGLLDSFNIGSSGRPVFMSVVLVPEPTAYLQLAIVVFAALLTCGRKRIA